MHFRSYDSEKDREAAQRIWLEVGWMQNSDRHKQALDIFLGGGRALVAEANGSAESLAHAMPGTLRYLDESLVFSAVTAVVTSRVARKRGFAKRLTARLVAEEAAGGAQVSGLGIFEQGFYNRLGYGCGPYEYWIGFDPAQLKVKVPAAVPRRLEEADWEPIHQAMLARQSRHGACNLAPAAFVRAELLWTSGGFGLGYETDGRLTHFIWGRAKGEHGPYTITARAYQNGAQFLELMGLLRSLGDQVREVWIREPAGIQMQDLLRQPFRYRKLTRKSDFENRVDAIAYWQARICDLPGCLAKTHLWGGPVRFNLKLNDPIARLLDGDAPWPGIGGEYVVTLGPESAAELGEDAALPTLTASVGAFTRMWLGAAPATGLAVTDSLAGPPDLLHALDRALCLPTPKVDWDF